MKRIIKLTIIIAILAAAILIGKSFFKSDESAQFRTADITTGDIEESVSASGTLNPVTLVNVGTQVSGIVKTLNVDYNDEVKEGDVLAELDQSVLQAQLQQDMGNYNDAAATSKLSRADYDRQKELFDKGYISKADLDKAAQVKASAAAKLSSVSAQIDRDKVNIGYSVIKSPVSGVVISRAVDVGQTVAASFQTPTLFIIAKDLQKMQIDTNLSEADIGVVREDMPVHFTVDAYPGRTYEAKVRQIRLNPTNVQNVVTYNVVIDVDNPDKTLLPGMTAFVSLVEASKENVIRLPNSALSYKPSAEKAKEFSKEKPKGKVVYVLKDGHPEATTVKTGITDGRNTEIISGLAAGDKVITGEVQTEKKAASSGANLFGGGGRGGRGAGMRL